LEQWEQAYLGKTAELKITQKREDRGSTKEKHKKIDITTLLLSVRIDRNSRLPGI